MYPLSPLLLPFPPPSPPSQSQISQQSPPDQSNPSLPFASLSSPSEVRGQRKRGHSNEPKSMSTDTIFPSLLITISLLLGTTSKSRKVESRHIKDYFSKADSCPVTPPLSIETQTEMTLSSIADLEGRTQNESLVSSLQSRVAELERFLTVCKEKLETTTVRLNKCLTVGKELLIEKVLS